jgi:hypothetical protein
MKAFTFRKAAILGLAAFAAMTPVAASAQMSGWGIFYFNDGQGTCGYVSCGENGCSVIDTFPCPREVSGG